MPSSDVLTRTNPAKLEDGGVLWRVELEAYMLYESYENSPEHHSLRAASIAYVLQCEVEMENRSFAREYPEHAKLAAVKEESQVVGNLLEWLEETDRTIYRWHEAGNNLVHPFIDNWYGREAISKTQMRFRSEYSEAERYEHPEIKKLGGFHFARFDQNPEYHSWTADFYPEHVSITGLLEEYFGIDGYKLSMEKNKMLQKFREEAF